MTGPGGQTARLLLAVACGVGTGTGLWLLAGAGRLAVARLARLLAARFAGVSRPRRVAQAAGAAAGGLLVGAVTGWPVAGLLAAVAALTVPRLLAAGRHDAAETAKVEAVAAWAEMLADTLAGAAGLEQAVLATAPIAPGAVREPVADLAAALRAGARLPDALAVFAEAVDDPTADLVAVSLVLASTRQARQLGELLGRLANAAHDQAALRLRVAASRARTRTSTRIVVSTTLVMAFGLVLFSPAFVEPYDSATGQLVLLAVGGLFAAAFGWLARTGRHVPPGRVLTNYSRFETPDGLAGANPGQGGRR